MMKGFEEGAIDYFFKPLDPEVVKAKVNVHLKVQLQKKELVDKNSALQKSALLISNSADIIGIIDAITFEIEEVNLSFTTILGYSAEEAREKPVTFFLDDEDKTRFNDLVKQSEEHLSIDTGIFCKDGSIKWLQWKIVARDKKWYVNARDITEIRQLNRDLHNKVTELTEVNRELESFSYSVSHDLRSPLRALDGYSKMFEEDYMELLNDDAKKLLGKIQYNAKKMGVLIDDLLAFSKLGRKQVQKQQLDTHEIVEHVLHETSNSTSRKAAIKINSLPASYADHSLIYQVWTNLISNALKYSEKKESPEIEIGAKDAENETTYYVKDNGAGFDMAYADKLFGVFQRLHSTEEFEGTGIGLAIVQRIIARHGGNIRAEGKVNEGATFYFTLPKMINK
jgi:PAS domain S-box-containing protein